MAKQASRTSSTGAPAPRARRLTAEARRSSILKAARRAFSETGDMNGTTIKVIAEHSGISEGVIYRHFESKDQLFFEAVVEPLREAVDELVAAAEEVDRDEPLTPERQVETLNGFPVLSRACQSSVPGLYFVGAAAAVSLGPSQRFLAGTHNSVRQLTKSLARRHASVGAETADRRITATP